MLGLHWRSSCCRQTPASFSGTPTVAPKDSHWLVVKHTKKKKRAQKMKTMTQETTYLLFSRWLIKDPFYRDKNDDDEITRMTNDKRTSHVWQSFLRSPSHPHPHPHPSSSEQVFIFHWTFGITSVKMRQTINGRSNPIRMRNGM